MQNGLASDLYGKHSTEYESHEFDRKTELTNKTLNRNAEINYEAFAENTNLTYEITNAYENIKGVNLTFDDTSDANCGYNIVDVYPHYNVIGAYDKSASGHVNLIQNLEFTSESGIIEFWFLVSRLDIQAMIFRTYGNSVYNVYISMMDNFVQCYNGSEYKSYFYIDNNTWYHLKVDYNCYNNNYNLYLNTELIGYNIPFNANTTNIDSIMYTTASGAKDFTFCINGVALTANDYTSYDNYFYPLNDFNYISTPNDLLIDDYFEDRYLPITSWENTSYIESLYNKTDILNISDYDGGNDEQLGMEYNFQNSQYIDFSIDTLIDVSNEGYNITFWSNSTLITMFYCSSFNWYWYDSFNSPNVITQIYDSVENIWFNIRFKIDLNDDTITIYINNHLVIDQKDLLDSVDYSNLNKIKIATQYINVDYSLYIANLQYLVNNGSHIVKSIPDYSETTNKWYNSKQLHLFDSNRLSVNIHTTTAYIFSHNYIATFIFQLNENASINILFRNTTDILLKGTIDTQINRISLESSLGSFSSYLNLQSNYGYTYYARLTYAPLGLSQLVVVCLNTGNLLIVYQSSPVWVSSYDKLHYQIDFNNPSIYFNGTLSAVDSTAFLEYEYNQLLGSSYDSKWDNDRILETYYVVDSSYNDLKYDSYYSKFNINGSYTTLNSFSYMNDNLANADRPRDKYIDSLKFQSSSVINISIKSNIIFNKFNFSQYMIMDVSNVSYISMNCGNYWVNLTFDDNEYNILDDKTAGSARTLSRSDAILDNTDYPCFGVYVEPSDNDTLVFIYRYKYTRLLIKYNEIDVSLLTKPIFYINSSIAEFNLLGVNYDFDGNIDTSDKKYWFYPNNHKYRTTYIHSKEIKFTEPALPNPYSGYKKIYAQVISFNTTQYVNDLPDSIYYYDTFIYVGQNDTQSGVNTTINGVHLMGYVEFVNFNFTYHHTIYSFDYANQTYDTSTTFGITWVFLLDEPNPSLLDLAVKSISPLIMLLIFPFILGKRFGKIGAILGLILGFVIFGISQLISMIYTVILCSLTFIMLIFILKFKKADLDG